MQEYLFIGDIAGRYELLIKLIDAVKKKYPNIIPFSVGEGISISRGL